MAYDPELDGLGLAASPRQPAMKGCEEDDSDGGWFAVGRNVFHDNQLWEGPAASDGAAIEDTAKRSLVLLAFARWQCGWCEVKTKEDGRNDQLQCDHESMIIPRP